MGQHEKHGPLVRLAAALLMFASPADACRLALILAIDVSSSVDPVEDRLQRQGLAAALRDEAVTAAFFASPDPVALAVFEWSGRYNQRDILDWRSIVTPADLTAAADAVARSQRSHDDYPTAIGHALGHASIRLSQVPNCLFKTIDVAGDGINNDGFGPPDAYGAFPFVNVTVNGLIVTSGEADADDALIAHYANDVLRGPAAFYVEANGFADYERAMRLKLLRELSALIIGAVPSLQVPKG